MNTHRNMVTRTRLALAIVLAVVVIGVLVLSRPLQALPSAERSPDAISVAWQRSEA
jgi:hypothetical protein